MCQLIIKQPFLHFAFSVKPLVHRGITETLVWNCALWQAGLCTLCVASGCVTFVLKCDGASSVGVLLTTADWSAASSRGDTWPTYLMQRGVFFRSKSQSARQECPAPRRSSEERLSLS